jgi:hypothetical protein
MKTLVVLLAVLMFNLPAYARCYDTSVNEEGIDGWRVYFYPGQDAEVHVYGDGDTDLDCVVLDQSGEPFRSDRSYNKNCHLEWYTRYGGEFTIGVYNQGEVYNKYSLCTNGRATNAQEIR